MKKIFIRSPYFIEINETGQVGSKVELYFYHKGESVPSTPTYTLAKKIPSATQTNTVYNISPYAKEQIDVEAPDVNHYPVGYSEDVNIWTYVDVKRYKETSADVYSLLDTETIVCLNGFTKYEDGYNYYTTDTIVALHQYTSPFRLLKESGTTAYVNYWVEYDNATMDDLYWSGQNDLLIFDSSSYDGDHLLKLPLDSTNKLVYYTLSGNDDYAFYATEVVCEPKYTPIVCSFMNRFGGWSFITFFKAKTARLSVDKQKYNLLPSGVDYNVLKGQKQTFNHKGNKNITCNTGWVSEDYNDLIEDLLLSENVLLDEVPVTVKTSDYEYKTGLKDKNINHTIEFEYAFNFINDVI